MSNKFHVPMLPKDMLPKAGRWQEGQIRLKRGRAGAPRCGAPTFASTRQRQNRTTGCQAGKTTPAPGLQLQGCQLGQLLPLADSFTVQERSLVSWKTPCPGTRTLSVSSASGEPHAGTRQRHDERFVLLGPDAEPG